MGEIRDPALKQMVADFNQQSATIVAYHRLALRRVLFDQMYGAHRQGDPFRLVEPHAQPPTMVTRDRSLLVKASQWAIRALNARMTQPAPSGTAEARPAQTALVIDVSYTIEADQPPPAVPKESNAWDK